MSVRTLFKAKFTGSCEARRPVTHLSQDQAILWSAIALASLDVVLEIASIIDKPVAPLERVQSFDREMIHPS